MQIDRLHFFYQRDFHIFQLGFLGGGQPLTFMCRGVFLILQDDTQLNPGWVGRLHELMHDLESQWERVLLVWWGLKRSRDCTAHFCSVRPPAGPTDSGPECCGKRFYHGLQVRKAASPASPPPHHPLPP